MKTKHCINLLIIGIALLGVASIGKSDRQVKHKVVVLQCWQRIVGGAYYGNYVYNSDSSEGAPTFPNYPSASYVMEADAIAQLLDDGFELLHKSDNGLNWTFVQGR